MPWNLASATSPKDVQQPLQRKYWWPWVLPNDLVCTRRHGWCSLNKQQTEWRRTGETRDVQPRERSDSVHTHAMRLSLSSNITSELGNWAWAKVGINRWNQSAWRLEQPSSSSRFVSQQINIDGNGIETTPWKSSNSNIGTGAKERTRKLWYNLVRLYTYHYHTRTNLSTPPFLHHNNIVFITHRHIFIISTWIKIIEMLANLSKPRFFQSIIDTKYQMKMLLVLQLFEISRTTPQTTNPRLSWPFILTPMPLPSLPSNCFCTLDNRRDSSTNL